MNEQKPPKGIEWTRIQHPDGTTMRGFAWNPIAGCKHGCQWCMSDHTVASCYAETVANNLARSAYPHGFRHHYFFPNRLDEPLRLGCPAGIFLDSMSDLLGCWVPDDHIQQVLAVCREAFHHTFFLLTKNAPRLLAFDFPPNVWLGASIPPDWILGRRLAPAQKDHMLRRALSVLSKLPRHNIRWMSFEPLSWNVGPIVVEQPAALDWAVIGGASNGTKKYLPDLQHFGNLYGILEAAEIPMFFKGNLRALPYAETRWQEKFPQSRGV